MCLILMREVVTYSMASSRTPSSSPATWGGGGGGGGMPCIHMLHQVSFRGAFTPLGIFIVAHTLPPPHIHKMLLCPPLPPSPLLE